MKKVISTVLICLSLLVVLYPFETISIPEWRLRVVDGLGNPMPNNRVRQHWSHGGIKTEQADLISDSDGFVVFPARTIRRPLIIRILTQFFLELNNLVLPHGASTGPRASVIDAGGARTNYPNYYEGKEFEKLLILIDYPYPK